MTKIIKSQNDIILFMHLSANLLKNIHSQLFIEIYKFNDIIINWQVKKNDYQTH